MNVYLRNFEIACREQGLEPLDVISRAGLSRATWYRWKSGKVFPNLRNLETARSALATMVGEKIAGDMAA